MNDCGMNFKQRGKPYIHKHYRIYKLSVGKVNSEEKKQKIYQKKNRTDEILLFGVIYLLRFGTFNACFFSVFLPFVSLCCFVFRYFGSLEGSLP